MRCFDAEKDKYSFLLPYSTATFIILVKHYCVLLPTVNNVALKHFQIVQNYQQAAKSNGYVLFNPFSKWLKDVRVLITAYLAQRYREMGGSAETLEQWLANKLREDILGRLLAANMARMTRAVWKDTDPQG